MLILLLRSLDNLFVTCVTMIFCPQSVLIKIVPAIMMNSSVINTHLSIFLKVFRSRALDVKITNSPPKGKLSTKGHKEAK